MRQEFALDYVELDDSDDDDIVELPHPSTQPLTPKYSRNLPIAAPLQELTTVEHRGVILKPGKDVQLLPPDGKSGDFMRIKHIIKNPAGDITLRGLRFRRSKYLPVPDRFTNEVCLVAEACKDDSRPLLQQGQFECPLSEVVCKRRIIITRDSYPRHSFHELGYVDPNRGKDEECLVCRYVYSPVFETAWNPKAKRRAKAVEGTIRRVLAEESDRFDGVGQYRHPFNMGKIRAGDLTYVSGCCGAGGDVTGAKMAGLKPVIAFDHWETACQSCLMNHPDVDVYHLDQAAAITGIGTKIPVPQDLTLLHSSFPCVFFSPAHTVVGKDDDKNDALILATGAHLDYWKPLIHTQEQTSGILSHHPDYFFTVMADVVGKRYNVRWKVCRFEEYGLPALRKRLILFAAR